MKLFVQPSRWSCLPTAFAMCCDVPPEKIFEIIGHDGSSILYPELPDPVRRRAFHFHECTYAAYKLGYATTLFPQYDNLCVDDSHSIKVDLNFDPDELLRGTGVLMGDWHKDAGRIIRHAVAFDRCWLYDPNGKTYRFDPEKIKPDIIALISKSEHWPLI